MSNEIRLLAAAFHTDAHHNLVIAKASKKDPLYPRDEIRAKVLVILHMSIECALKCAIALAEPEGELVTRYKTLKKGGHDLGKLLAAITVPDFDGLRDRIKAFNPPGVGLRYGFELMILNPDRLFKGGRRPGLGDSQIEDAFQLAQAVYKVTDKLYKAAYGQSFQWKNGDSPKRVIDRIKDGVHRGWK
jgi:hypothetical protein